MTPPKIEQRMKAEPATEMWRLRGNMTKLPDWAQRLADQGAEVEVLDVLQHAEIGDGPWKLYIYGKSGYHTGGIWFRRGPMQYPDEEIAASEAKCRSDRAIADKREVRICDGGDMLVFHAKDGHILYGEGFWNAAIPL